MWEKVLVIILFVFGLILYAFTVHLDKALNDPLIKNYVEVGL